MTISDYARQHNVWWKDVREWAMANLTSHHELLAPMSQVDDSDLDVYEPAREDVWRIYIKTVTVPGPAPERTP